MLLADGDALFGGGGFDDQRAAPFRAVILFGNDYDTHGRTAAAFRRCDGKPVEILRHGFPGYIGVDPKTLGHTLGIVDDAPVGQSFDDDRRAVGRGLLMNRNGVLLRSGSDGDRTRTQFADIGIRSNLHLHRNACCSAGRADFSPFQAGLHEFPRPVAFDREGDLRHIRSCNGELLFDSRNTQFVGFGRNPVVSGTGPEEYRCKNRKQSGEKVKFEGVHNALNCRFRLLFRAKIKLKCGIGKPAQGSRKAARDPLRDYRKGHMRTPLSGAQRRPEPVFHSYRGHTPRRRGRLRLNGKTKF